MMKRSWLLPNPTFQKNEFKSAVIQLKNLLQNSPSSAEGRFLLAKSLAESGDLTGAEIELKRATELRYSTDEIALEASKILLRKSDFKKLTDQFSEVTLGRTAANAELKTNIAVAFAAQNLPEKSRDAITKAIELQPDSLPAQLTRALLKAEQKDFDGAIAVLDAVLSKNPRKFDALRLKADVQLKGKNDTLAAIATYKQALAVQADSAELHATLISLYLSQENAKAASDQYVAMKKELPEHALTRFFEAQLAFANGDYPRARELSRAMLLTHPENPATLHLAGATEFQLNALAQAETYLTQAVQLQPQFMGARRLLAQTYLQSDRPAKAVAVLQPLLDRPGVDVDTLLLAGRAYLLVDDTKAADAIFKRAGALRPKDNKVRAELAIAQLVKGKADIAFSELQAISAGDTGVIADMATISGRMKRGEFEPALRAIAELEKKLPKDPLPADLRGRLYLLRGDLVTSRQNFEQAVALNPRYTPAIIKLGALDLIEKKPEAADTRIRNLLKLDPKNVQGWLALADLKRRSGGTEDEVAKLITEAITANPMDPEPRVALINHHFVNSDVKSALSAAQNAVAAIPLSAELLDKLGRSQMANFDLNQAITTFTKITSQEPESPIGYQGLAEIAIAKRDLPAASKYVKRAIELGPKSLAAQQTGILVAMAQKNPRDALLLANTIQTQHGDDSLGFILEGEIEADQMRWDQAAAAFRRALKKTNPGRAPMRLHAVLLSGKKDADATKFAEQWASEHPRDVLFAAYLAQTATNRGDLMQAEQQYLRILQWQPQNAIALNNLAWLLIKQNRNGAVNYAERALKSAPDQVGMMDTLAMAYSNENQHGKAIELQKKVLGLSPEEPTFHLTLAKIYLRAGEKPLAKAALDGLSQQKKPFPGREEVPQLYKTLNGGS
jgi:putative PEP-CTERM system TPR-repeat lipoprotein